MSHQALVRLPGPSGTVAAARGNRIVSLSDLARSESAAISQRIPIDDDDFSGDNYVLSTLSLETDIAVPMKPAVIARWRDEIESLSAEQRQLFLQGLPDTGLQSYVDSVGDLISDKVQTSKSLRLGKWIAPLVQFVEMSRPFADALNSAYPPAGMILGGVSFVLSMSKRFVDYQEAILAFLVKVCKNMSVIDRYKAEFPDTEEMQLALIDVFGDILQFCARASKPFLDSKGNSRMTVVSFLKSQIRSFEAEFGDLEKNLTAHLEVFDRTAILALGRMSTHLQKTQLLGLKLQARSHEADKRQRLEEEERRIKAVAKEQDEFRQRILSWISLTDFRRVQDEKLENTLPGTAQWLLEHETFQSWKQQSRPNLLYLHGKAGSGKSHLAARLIRDIDLWCREQNASLEKLEDQRKYAMAYAYCGSNMTETSGHRNLDRPSEVRGGAAAILTTVLRQLYSFLPRDEDVALVKDLYLSNQSGNLSIEDVRQGIKLLVPKFTRAIIVIDGLDECSGLKEIEFENLCAFITSLASSTGASSPASVIIFSRPGYSTIEDVIGEAARVQVDVGANQADINIFISERTKNLTSNLSTLQEIKATLSEDADGMFLWVSLVIDSIKKERSDNKRKKAAKNMPKGLAGAYSVALHRVMAQEESVKDVALRTLLWIANSERPLDKAELLEALSIEQGMTDIEPGDRIDDLSLVKDCADLVLLKNGRYCLLHVSLKEYLTHPPSVPSDPFAEYWSLQSKSQAIIAELCLTYLSLDTFKNTSIKDEDDKESLLDRYPLLSYASQNWGKHVAKVASTERNMILPLARDFLEDEHLVHGWEQLVSTGDDFDKVTSGSINSTPLHLMSVFGLQELIPYFDPAGLQLDSRDLHGRMPVDIAFGHGHKGMAEWFINQLELQIHNTGEKSFILHEVALVWLAAHNNWVDILARLLDMGVDKNQYAQTSDQSWSTALQRAILNGSDEAVLFLIKAGANLEFKDSFGETALMTAVVMQRLRIVDVLLDLRADVALRGRNGTTVLEQATRHNLLRPVKKILEYDAVDLAELNVNRSLLVAAAFGADSVIDALLEHGADLEGRTDKGLTPLLLAASRGHLDAVKKLLSRGAQLTARTSRKETIFHHLFSTGPINTIDVLDWILEHGDEYAKIDPLHPLDPVTIEDGLPAESVTIKLALLLSQDADEVSPLQKAASDGEMRAIMLLLQTPLRYHMIASHGNTCLQRALRMGDFDHSKALFDACKEVFSEYPPPDETWMNSAAESGNTALIPLVLMNSGSPVAADKEHGRTPLHIAAFLGRLEFIRSLAEQVEGLDYCHKDHYGETPLHRATIGAELEAIQLLLPHYSIDKDLGDKTGDWPLHIAAADGHIECVKALVDFDPSGVNRPNNRGDTALHEAVWRGHASIIKYLLDTAGADGNAANDIEETILFDSISSNKTGMALFILSNWPSLAKTGVKKDGWTALHEAAARGNEAVVGQLLDCGCEPHPETKRGETPFREAAYYQHCEIVDLYLSRGLDQAVRRCGPRSNCALAAARTGDLVLWRKFIGLDDTLAAGLDEDGDDAVCIAADSGHTHMLEEILALGFDVNGRSRHRNTALITATIAGNVGTVRYLCQKGVNLNGQDIHGRTALHWAVIYGYEQCYNALLEVGVNEHIRDDLGVLAKDYTPYLPVVFGTSGPNRDNYDPRDIHLPTIRNFALESLRRIESTNVCPTSDRVERLSWESERLVELATLVQAFCLLGELHAAALVQRGRMHSGRLMGCSICSSRDISDGNPAKKTYYYCIQCFTSKCKLCHSLQVNHIAPIKQLEIMERDVVTARRVLRPLAHYRYQIFYDVLNTHRAFWDWVRKKEEAYRLWETRCTTKGWNFRRAGFPGWELMSILKTIGDHFGRSSKSATPGVSERNPPFYLDAGVELTDRIRDLFSAHSPDEEPTFTDCEGHAFVEILADAELPDGQKAMFGPEKEFTKEFFQALEGRCNVNKQAHGMFPSEEESDGTPVSRQVYSEGQKREALELTASEAEEDNMHVVADMQVEFLIISIQHDLMHQWRSIQPGKQGKTQEIQELVLETAWQLAQAIAYHEVRMPSLADLNDEGPIRSYWRKGSESGDSDTESLLSSTSSSSSL